MSFPINLKKEFSLFNSLTWLKILLHVLAFYFSFLLCRHLVYSPLLMCHLSLLIDYSICSFIYVVKIDQGPTKMAGAHDTTKGTSFPPKHRSWCLEDEGRSSIHMAGSLGRVKITFRIILSPRFRSNMSGMTLGYFGITSRTQESLFTKKITGKSSVT